MSLRMTLRTTSDSADIRPTYLIESLRPKPFQAFRNTSWTISGSGPRIKSSVVDDHSGFSCPRSIDLESRNKIEINNSQIAFEPTDAKPRREPSRRGHHAAAIRNGFNVYICIQPFRFSCRGGTRFTLFVSASRVRPFPKIISIKCVREDFSDSGYEFQGPASDLARCP